MIFILCDGLNGYLLLDLSKLVISLPASSPIWVSEVSLARTREQGGQGKESLQRSLINFHFHPGKPRDSAKRENCHRKRACRLEK